VEGSPAGRRLADEGGEPARGAGGWTLPIYESDYDDEDLPLIRSLIGRDPRAPGETA
jgi:hypothetical protein